MMGRLLRLPAICKQCGNFALFSVFTGTAIGIGPAGGRSLDPRKLHN
jgi:hypothetical protein